MSVSNQASETAQGEPLPNGAAEPDPVISTVETADGEVQSEATPPHGDPLRDEVPPAEEAAADGSESATEQAADAEDRTLDRSPEETRVDAPEAALSEPAPAADEAGSSEAMRGLFQDLLNAMGVDGDVRVREDTSDQLTLDIGRCADASLIIGRHGQTVDDLQFLGGLILNSSRKERKRFLLNVENYRERREETLRRSAQALAKQVAEYGQEAVLDPLPPHERRIIHMALVDSPDVYTYSEGEEPDRRIVISPRVTAAARAAQGTGPVGSASDSHAGSEGESGNLADDQPGDHSGEQSVEDLRGGAAAGVENAAFGEGELDAAEEDAFRGETEFGLPEDPAQGAGSAGLPGDEPRDRTPVAGAADAEGRAAEPGAAAPDQMPETPAGGGSHEGHTGG